MGRLLQNRKLRIKFTRITPAMAHTAYVWMAWTFSALLVYLTVVVNRLPVVSALAPYVPDACVICAVVVALPHIAKKIRAADVLFITMFVLSYILSLLLLADNQAYLLEQWRTVLLSALPMYFVGRTIAPEKQLDALYVGSVMTIYVRWAYTLFSAGVNGMWARGDMHLAYLVLPHVALVLLYMMRRVTIVNSVTSVAGVLLLLAAGSRGPLLVLIILCVLYALFYRRYKKRWRAYLLIFGLALIALLSLDALLAWLRTIITQLGMSTRVLDMLDSGSIGAVSGRDVLLERLIPKIWERPITGYGYAGDRTIVGLYAHNLIVEFLITYGFLLGSVLLFALFALIWRAFRRTTGDKARIFLLVLFGCGFVKLFMSSSFILEKLFFCLLGYCVSQSNQAAARKRKRALP